MIFFYDIFLHTVIQLFLRANCKSRWSSFRFRRIPQDETYPRRLKKYVALIVLASVTFDVFSAFAEIEYDRIHCTLK